MDPISRSFAIQHLTLLRHWPTVDYQQIVPEIIERDCSSIIDRVRWILDGSWNQKPTPAIDALTYLSNEREEISHNKWTSGKRSYTGEEQATLFLLLVDLETIVLAVISFEVSK